MIERETALHPRVWDQDFRLAERPSLQGKTVLISGAGTGIGRGAALEFAREGAKVALHYFHAEEGLRSAIDLIKTAGGEAEGFQADFGDPQQVRTLAAEATRYLGHVDVLVNNAGITANIPFFEVTEKQFDTLLAVNFKAAYFLTQQIAQGMIERHSGRIVNLGSFHAYTAYREHSVYAATKAAVEAFTRVIAIELAPHGIRANCVVPGWCLTENHFEAVSPGTDFKKAGEAIPAGYLSSPYDLGRLLVFLATEAADYFVGETIKFTGGLSALMPNTGDFRQRMEHRFGRGYVDGIE